MLCLYLALFGSNISLVTMMMLGSIMAGYLPLLQEVMFISFWYSPNSSVRWETETSCM